MSLYGIKKDGKLLLKRIMSYYGHEEYSYELDSMYGVPYLHTDKNEVIRVMEGIGQDLDAPGNVYKDKQLELVEVDLVEVGKLLPNTLVAK